MKMKDSKKKKRYFSFLQKGKSKKTQKVVAHQSFIYILYKKYPNLPTE
jgi:hypothetical protein